ncbi:hypothetical protein K7432_016560 [Basidiobolus ranarum]|uniref:Pentatricopeptide repeat-containing protein n=1 Tax=Basidiobolus ranarum TaxID=34480 RepID=A0ABR2VLK1_9FUNG
MLLQRYFSIPSYNIKPYNISVSISLLQYNIIPRFQPPCHINLQHARKYTSNFITSIRKQSTLSTKVNASRDPVKKVEETLVKKRPKNSQISGVKLLRFNCKVAMENALNERNVSAAWRVFEEILSLNSLKYISTVQLSRLLGLLIKNCEHSLETKKKALSLVMNMKSLDIHFKSSRELQPLLLYYYRYGTLEEVQTTFHEISSLGLVTDAYVSNIYLDAIGKKSGKLAFKEFENLLSNGVIPDVFTFSTLLKNCRNEKDPALVSKIHDTFTKLGVKANSVCYTILIDTYGKSLQSEKVKETFDSMKRDGITVDTVMLNTVLNAMAKSGKVEDILTMYTSMTGSGLKPNLITFNTLLKGIVFEDGFNEKHLDLVRDEMKRHRIVPDIITYNTLLKGYLMHSEFEKGDRVYREIISTSHPDIITFNTLIEGYSAKSLDQAVGWIGEMQKRNMSPNCSTYNTIMNGYLKTNRPQKSLEYYDVLRKEKIQPTHITYGILMNCYSYLHKHPEVVTLWSEAVETFPLYTLNGALSVALDSYGYHSSASELRAFWSKLKERDFPFSENNLSAYIEALCHLGDVAYSIEVFWTECEQYKLEPSEKTVEIISRFLFKSSDTGRLKRFSQELRESYPNLHQHLRMKKLSS